MFRRRRRRTHRRTLCIFIIGESRFVVGRMVYSSKVVLRICERIRPWKQLICILTLNSHKGDSHPSSLTVNSCQWSLKMGPGQRSIRSLGCPLYDREVLPINDRELQFLNLWFQASFSEKSNVAPNLEKSTKKSGIFFFIIFFRDKRVLGLDPNYDQRWSK